VRETTRGVPDEEERNGSASWQGYPHARGPGGELHLGAEKGMITWKKKGGNTLRGAWRKGNPRGWGGPPGLRGKNSWRLHFFRRGEVERLCEGREKERKILRGQAVANLNHHRGGP